jgi:hypothetical protein
MRPTIDDPQALSHTARIRIHAAIAAAGAIARIAFPEPANEIYLRRLYK